MTMTMDLIEQEMTVYQEMTLKQRLLEMLNDVRWENSLDSLKLAPYEPALVHERGEPDNEEQLQRVMQEWGFPRSSAVMKYAGLNVRGIQRTQDVLNKAEQQFFNALRKEVPDDFLRRELTACDLSFWASHNGKEFGIKVHMHDANAGIENALLLASGRQLVYRGWSLHPIDSVMVFSSDGQRYELREPETQHKMQDYSYQFSGSLFQSEVRFDLLSIECMMFYGEESRSPIACLDFKRVPLTAVTMDEIEGQWVALLPYISSMQLAQANEMPRVRVDEMDQFEGVERLLPDSFVRSKLRREIEDEARRRHQQHQQQHHQQQQQRVSPKAQRGWSAFKGAARGAGQSLKKFSAESFLSPPTHKQKAKLPTATPKAPSQRKNKGPEPYVASPEEVSAPTRAGYQKREQSPTTNHSLPIIGYNKKAPEWKPTRRQQPTATTTTPSRRPPLGFRKQQYSRDPYPPHYSSSSRSPSRSRSRSRSRSIFSYQAGRPYQQEEEERYGIFKSRAREPSYERRSPPTYYESQSQRYYEDEDKENQDLRNRCRSLWFRHSPSRDSFYEQARYAAPQPPSVEIRDRVSHSYPYSYYQEREERGRGAPAGWELEQEEEQEQEQVQEREQPESRRLPKSPPPVERKKSVPRTPADEPSVREFTVDSPHRFPTFGRQSAEVQAVDRVTKMLDFY